MKDVSKKMDFEVYTDLKYKNKVYNITIDLENEVDSYTRELAIALSGAIVRNNCKKVYDKFLDNTDLSLLIQERLNTWIPENTQFRANRVTAALKPENKR